MWIDYYDAKENVASIEYLLECLIIPYAFVCFAWLSNNFVGHKRFQTSASLTYNIMSKKHDVH